MLIATTHLGTNARVIAHQPLVEFTYAGKGRNSMHVAQQFHRLGGFALGGLPEPALSGTYKRRVYLTRLGLAGAAC